MNYNPDGWSILRIVYRKHTGNKDDVGAIYKVFGTFCGGYSSGDAWRLNSGIHSYFEKDNMISFVGFSGSQYDCDKKDEGFHTRYTESVLKNAIDNSDGCATIITLEEFIKEFKAS